MRCGGIGTISAAGGFGAGPEVGGILPSDCWPASPVQLWSTIVLTVPMAVPHTTDRDDRSFNNRELISDFQPCVSRLQVPVAPTLLEYRMAQHGVVVRFVHVRTISRRPFIHWHW